MFVFLCFVFCFHFKHLSPEVASLCGCHVPCAVLNLQIYSELFTLSKTVVLMVAAKRMDSVAEFVAGDSSSGKSMWVGGKFLYGPQSCVTSMPRNCVVIH